MLDKLLDFLLNPHLAIFDLFSFLGFILLAYAPLHYCIRNKIVMMNFKDLFNYNAIEMRSFLFGTILMVVGIWGHSIVFNKYGRRVKAKEPDGSISIYTDYPKRKNLNTINK